MCELQKPALLCPAWAVLPASKCAPGLKKYMGSEMFQLIVLSQPTIFSIYMSF
jgi:hypothetical protein